MVKYLFENILGTHIFNNNFKLVMTGKDNIKSKFKDLTPLPDKHISQILSHFQNKKFFADFYNSNTELTRSQLKASVNDDNLITQTINAIEETKKTINILAKRLREWFGLYLPELRVEDHELYVNIILKDDKNQILKKLKISDSIGTDLSKEDLTNIKSLAKEIKALYNIIKDQEAYLEKIMTRHCPNLTALASSLIGAKLLEQAGSLKHLSEFPSSTIQLLGAEEALFRHLKTKAPSPKYGFLHEHPLVLNAKSQIRGKVARTLADKIAIAVKVDFFKGKPIGEKLRKALEAKFK